jgi:outer membrane biosynthesis protein TonB
MQARGAIPYLVLGSLAAHAAIFYGWDPGFTSAEQEALRPPNVIELVPLKPGAEPLAPARLETLEPPKPPEPPPPPHGQVVETPNLPEAPVPPEVARFLAEKNIRVAKETASALGERPGFSGSPHPPSLPAGGPSEPERKRVQEQAQSPGSGLQPNKLYPSYRDLWQLSPASAGKESSSPTEPGELADPGAGRIDYLDGVVAGEITALNTQAFRYAAFYNRIKAAVRAYWSPGSAVLRSGQPRHDLDTYVQVVTDAQGKLVSTPQVIHSCGYPAVDEAAVQAIAQATPFYGVPEGVLNDKKQFNEVWGFHVILR